VPWSARIVEPIEAVVKESTNSVLELTNTVTFALFVSHRKGREFLAVPVLYALEPVE
jgi:hypothetical protein